MQSINYHFSEVGVIYGPVLFISLSYTTGRFVSLTRKGQFPFFSSLSLTEFSLIER